MAKAHRRRRQRRGRTERQRRSSSWSRRARASRRPPGSGWGPSRSRFTDSTPRPRSSWWSSPDSTRRARAPDPRFGAGVSRPRRSRHAEVVRGARQSGSVHARARPIEWSRVRLPQSAKDIDEDARVDTRRVHDRLQATRAGVLRVSRADRIGVVGVGPDRHARAVDAARGGGPEAWPRPQAVGAEETSSLSLSRPGTIRARRHPERMAPRSLLGLPEIFAVHSLPPSMTRAVPSKRGNTKGKPSPKSRRNRSKRSSSKQTAPKREDVFASKADEARSSQNAPSPGRARSYAGNTRDVVANLIDDGDKAGVLSVVERLELEIKKLQLELLQLTQGTGRHSEGLTTRQLALLFDELAAQRNALAEVEGSEDADDGRDDTLTEVGGLDEDLERRAKEPRQPPSRPARRKLPPFAAARR